MNMKNKEMPAKEFQTLKELIKYTEETYTNNIAFVTKLKTKGSKDVTFKNTTYKDLYMEMCNAGTYLMNLPFSKSQVALIGENSYHWCLAYFTVSTSDNVIVPLDKLLQQDEIKSCIMRSKSKAIFCDKKHYEMVKEIVDEGETQIEYIIGLDFVPEGSVSIDDMIIEGKKKIDEGDRKYLDYKINPDDMHFLLFTSGTTQKSKAVMLSHKNICSVIYAMSLEEPFYEDDVNMIILPLHHVYGLVGTLMMVSLGVKNTFCDGLRYIVPNMKEYKVTVFMSVPLLLENMYKKIQKAIEKQGLEKKINFAKKISKIGDALGLPLRRKMFKGIINNLGGHLRFIINGAAAIDPEVIKGFNDFGILTVQGYGLTEMAPTISSESHRNLRPGSVGKFMPNVTGKIINPDEEGIGELIVKGDNVMLGYYENQEATENVIKNGWLHTGDYAYIDKDGFLFLSGRKKNVIVMKNGKNVFPEELENLINNLPYVSESMIFTRNKETDVVLWAKVVYDENYLKENNISKDELELLFKDNLNKINDTLPAYKMIKKFYLSNNPTIKTSTRKIKRNHEMKVIEEELKNLKTKL